MTESEIQTNLTYLCESMPNMSGCTLRTLCTGGQASGDYCSGFSLLADVCTDMPTMNGCQGFNTLCSTGTVVKQCLDNPAVSSLVGTDAAQADTLAACAAMVMTGCDTCTSAANCADPLTSLATVCTDMPSMSQCSGLQTMCTQGSTSSSFPTLCGAYSDGTTTSTVSMRMWLHASMKEMILMQPWTVRHRGPYIGSCIAVIFAAVLVQFLKAIRVQIEVSWAEVWRGELPHCGDGVVCNGGLAQNAAQDGTKAQRAPGGAGMRCGVQGLGAGCCSVPGNAAGSCCEMKSLASPAPTRAAECCGGANGTCTCGPGASCGGGSGATKVDDLSALSGSSDGSRDANAHGALASSTPSLPRKDLESGAGDSPDVSSDSEEEIEALPPCCRDAAVFRRRDRAARRAAQAARRRARRTGLGAQHSGRPQTPGEPLLGSPGETLESSHGHGVIGGAENILLGLSAASLASPPPSSRSGLANRVLGFLRIPAPYPTNRGVLVRNIVRSALTGITVFLDYMLMLIVMTFNIGIIVSAVIGFMLGTMFFGHWGERPTLAARDLSTSALAGGQEQGQVEFVEGGACCGGRV